MAKILLVEDDPMISEIYEKKFKDGGFDVETADSGKAVLSKASQGEFDLILLDLVLPEMSGIDVLKELKQSGKYSSRMKVIIFSNLSIGDEKDQAMNLGADGFIAKTHYNPSELVKEVKRKLNEFKEQEKNELRRKSGVQVSSDQKKNVLFIEDEEIFLEIFGKKLKDEGFNVDISRDGEDGIKKSEKKKYDAIITDMVMPKIDGKELIQRIRSFGNNKNTPIILISASATEEEVMQAKELGATECFMKTAIVPSQLSNFISELLR